MKRHPVSYLRDILENRRDAQEFVSGFSPQQFSDAAFCELCQHIQLWVAQENRSRRPENRISPPNEVVSRTRELASRLHADAPVYLHPSAQQVLLETPSDCLAVLENAVNWVAEKLYDVEGLGPFDEF